MRKLSILLVSIGLCISLEAIPVNSWAAHGPPGNSFREMRVDDRWGEAAEHEGFHHGKSQIPPGWSHGKKTGWHGADVPPGQADKVAEPMPLIDVPVISIPKPDQDK